MWFGKGALYRSIIGSFTDHKGVIFDSANPPDLSAGRAHFAFIMSKLASDTVLVYFGSLKEGEDEYSLVKKLQSDMYKTHRRKIGLLLGHYDCKGSIWQGVNGVKLVVSDRDCRAIRVTVPDQLEYVIQDKLDNAEYGIFPVYSLKTGFKTLKWPRFIVRVLSKFWIRFGLQRYSGVLIITSEQVLCE